jgi:hypothetical protein
MTPSLLALVVANLAGLLAAGPSHSNTSWTCGSLLEFGKSALSGFPNDNTPLFEDDAGASIAAFEKVFIQHMCPRAGPDDDPHTIGSIVSRYARHSWSPPCAILVRTASHPVLCGDRPPNCRTGL